MDPPPYRVVTGKHALSFRRRNARRRWLSLSVRAHDVDVGHGPSGGLISLLINPLSVLPGSLLALFLPTPRGGGLLVPDAATP